MSRLLNVGRRFQSVFKLITGQQFYGQMLGIPDTSRVSNFLSPRRYLRTMPITPIRNRDVVVINGLEYIVAEHGEGFYVTPIYKHFKLFEVDENVIWYPVSTQVDSVTGVSKLVRVTGMGSAYLSTQPKPSIDDEIKIPHKTKTAVTNVLAKVDDKLGDYIVTKADTVLGITLVELKLE